MTAFSPRTSSIPNFKQTSFDSHQHRENPFSPSFDISATVFVSNNVSLTISPKSLIISGESPTKLLNSRAKSRISTRRSITLDSTVWTEPMGVSATRSIALSNILFAEVSSTHELQISYAKTMGKSVMAPGILKYVISETDSAATLAPWIGRLLARAYSDKRAMMQKRCKVLLCPTVGKGTSMKVYEEAVMPMLDAARCTFDAEILLNPEHARNVGQMINVKEFDVIICCGGDKVVNQVFNGLSMNPSHCALSEVAVAQIPFGTSTSLAASMVGHATASLATVSIIKGIRTPLDLSTVTQGEQRWLSFSNQVMGLMAGEKLRLASGARGAYVYVKKAMQRKKWECDIAYDLVDSDKRDMRTAWYADAMKTEEDIEVANTVMRSERGLGRLSELRFGTVHDALPDNWKLIRCASLSSLLVGNLSHINPTMSPFPAALPSDGSLDLVAIPNELSLSASLSLIPSLENGRFFSMPQVTYLKVKAYRVTPKEGRGDMTVDGERCAFEPWQVEAHQGLGTVLSLSGRGFEGNGPTI